MTTRSICANSTDTIGVEIHSTVSSTPESSSDHKSLHRQSFDAQQRREINDKILAIFHEQMSKDVHCGPPLNFCAQNIQTVDHLMNELTKALTSKRLYQTKIQLQIMKILWSQAKNLLQGHSRALCGALVGARGIGKTTALRIFNAFAKFAFPHLVEIYINMDNIHTKGCSLQDKSVMEVVAEELERLGIQVPVDPNSRSLAEDLIVAVESAGVYLHLCVDDFEQIYKIDGDDHPSILRSLHELVALGVQPSSRIAVLLCGSSELFENLIRVNVSERMRESFPLLKTGAPRFDCANYPLTRIDSTTPIDLEAVARIIGLPFDTTNLPYLRLMAYSSGCSARDLENGVPVSDDVLIRNAKANEVHRLLWRKMLKRMMEKNQRLCDELFPSRSSAKLIIRSILTMAWEQRFLPLDFDDLQAIWSRLLRKGRVPTSENIFSASFYLADHNCLIFEGRANGRPLRIYPFTLGSLGRFILNERKSQSLSDGIQYLLQGGQAAVDEFVGETVNESGCVIS
jgi:hypothetical protein